MYLQNEFTNHIYLIYVSKQYLVLNNQQWLICHKVKSNYYIYGDIQSVMVIVVGNGHCDLSSNLGEAVCISHSANSLGKGMNPSILPPAMGK